MTADTDCDDGRMTPRPREGNAPWRMLRWLGRSGLLLGALTALALAGGFAWFVCRVPAREVQLNRDADGIVALTGGASRIADAIELLAAGHGRRLLISGINRATNPHEISRLNPEFGKWVRCCVDFDRSVNTLGNAIEIKRWSEQRGFHSLIVVTSYYHMPRALAEIAEAHSVVVDAETELGRLNVLEAPDVAFAG